MRISIDFLAAALENSLPWTLFKIYNPPSWIREKHFPRNTTPEVVSRFCAAYFHDFFYFHGTQQDSVLPFLLVRIDFIFLAYIQNILFADEDLSKMFYEYLYGLQMRVRSSASTFGPVLLLECLNLCSISQNLYKILPVLFIKGVFLGRLREIRTEPYCWKKVPELILLSWRKQVGIWDGLNYKLKQWGRRWLLFRYEKKEISFFLNLSWFDMKNQAPVTTTGRPTDQKCHRCNKTGYGFGRFRVFLNKNIRNSANGFRFRVHHSVFKKVRFVSRVIQKTLFYYRPLQSWSSL